MLLGISVAAASSAATLTFSGSFSADDNLVLTPVLLVSPGLVIFQTTSFADGSLGFNPVLALFDGSGNLLQVDQGGTVPACGGRSIDAASGYCLDAYIQTNLVAGNYTLALTEWDNLPNGPMLADGFSEMGNGNFTGPNALGTPGSFILFDGSQRSSQWALQLSGAGLAEVPEPASVGLVGCALLAALVGRGLRRGVEACR